MSVSAITDSPSIGDPTVGSSTHALANGGTTLPEKQTDSNHDHLLEQIEQTMDLIAEATSPARVEEAVVDISVIVPVFNERQTLPNIIERLHQVMPVSTEIIVIDDASYDGTTQWLEDQSQTDKFRVIHRRANHGKGSAVRLGIRHSRGRVVAIQDADLEYDPADLLRVIWPVLDGNAEAAYGSRYLDGQDRSILGSAVNRTLTALSNRITGLRLTDMETCHKAFEGDLIRGMDLREPRFGFEPEVTSKLAASDAMILEVPTRYERRSYAEGKKIQWRDGIEALACMWRYRNG
ncbi:MAG: glycosyltransferase family 2 protein [Planctomycetota bacterium]